MALFDLLNKINFGFRTRIFRREVEAWFYSDKKLRLPRVNYVGSDINHFKQNYPFSFYNNQGEYEKSREILESIEQREEIIGSADRVIGNKYKMPCSGDQELGDKIKWNFDYTGKFQWQNDLSWRADFMDFPKGVDIKNPWEIARFHQGLALGKGYLLTGDEKYTDKFLALISDFILQNPFCCGINWYDSSEVAIRLINVLFGFSFFIPSPKVVSEVLNSLINFSVLHSLFIENNLLYRRYRDHKYLIMLLGLLFAGLFFQNLSYGKKNLHFALNELEHEIRQQIYEDGVSCGQSVPFHSVILECFYLAYIIAGKGSINFSREYREKLYKIFKVQSAYLRTDGSVPLAGDQFSSRILDINLRNKTDYSFPLPPGAMIFKEAGFKILHSKITAEVLFLFGINAQDKYEKIVKKDGANFDQKSVGLEEGGHFIFRNKDLHFFIDAGELGKNANGPHIDIFSFELFYKKKKIIIDPGTFSYYSDKDLRNKLRSDISHNIFRIDDEPVSQPEGLFRIDEDLTKPKILEWESSDSEDILVAQHYAYTRLPDPVICKRTFYFLKDKNLIKIKDEFFGGKKHKAVFSITFHPDSELMRHDVNEYTASDGDSRIRIRFHSSAENFFTSIQDAFCSEEYGCLTKTRKIYTISEEKFPFFMITDIELL